MMVVAVMKEIVMSRTSMTVATGTIPTATMRITLAKAMAFPAVTMGIMAVGESLRATSQVGVAGVAATVGVAMPVAEAMPTVVTVAVIKGVARVAAKVITEGQVKNSC
jgi:hypothetical protein